jgi:ubiquinone/menaquinone biosynthesis C-methylase UbiE
MKSQKPEKGAQRGMASQPGRERRDTYLLDPENVAEMARLEVQGQLLTRGMGGPLPEPGRLPDQMLHVLDLGCGPGEWVRHVAREHPQTEVVGVDISQIMVAYAQSKAVQTNVSNVRFQVGNILDPLDFPDNSFDLVNARFLVAVLKTDRWAGFVRECLRLTRPGGWIRLTECDNGGHTNKAAFQQFTDWIVQASRQGGYGLAVTPDDPLITPMLEPLLREAGYHQVQQQAYTLDFSFGTDLYASQYQNYRVAFKQVQPLIVQMGITTQQEVEATYEDMLTGMAAEDFRGTWSFLTVLGQKS